MLRLAPFALVAALSVACSTTHGAATISGDRTFVAAAEDPATEAFDDYASSHGLRRLNVEARPMQPFPPPGEVVSAPASVSVEGIAAPESIVAVPAEGARVAFRTSPLSHDCDQGPQTEYRVAAADDTTVVVVRLVPHVTVEERHQSGSCGIGCGVAAPPPTSSLLMLPLATTHVRVVTVSWETTQVVVTCDNPIPMP
ncbi:MAG: hypothetical protein U0414_18170 [Polyangiaceae bacterium]